MCRQLPSTVLVHGAHEPSWFAELLLSAGMPDSPHLGKHNRASVPSLSPQLRELYPSVKEVIINIYIFFYIIIPLLFSTGE